MAIQIPQELPENLQKGKLVLFVGSGMSQPQVPGWKRLLERIMQQAERDHVYVNSDSPREIARLISDNDLLFAAENIKETLGKEFYPTLKRVFLMCGAVPTAAHGLLRTLRLRAIVTTNYDKLLESVYPGAHVYIYPNVPPLSDDFFIWKLHGDIDDEKSLVFGWRDYDRFLMHSPTVITLQGLFQQTMVLFIGYSITDEDLQTVLKTLANTLDHTGPHYALMNGVAGADIVRFQERLRIRIISDKH